MGSAVKFGTRGGEQSGKQRQAGIHETRERTILHGSGREAGARRRDSNFRKSFYKEGGGKSNAVTPFLGIIGDPCGPGSLMARYRTKSLLDNRQILLFMNVDVALVTPPPAHLFVFRRLYTRRRLHGDCRLQSRSRHVSKIVFRETYPRTHRCCRDQDGSVLKNRLLFSELLVTLIKHTKLKILYKTDVA